jgi:hypothetical protein
MMRQFHFQLFVRAVAVFAVACLEVYRSSAQGLSDVPPPPTAVEELNQPPGIPAQEQPEVLSRGPLHEAFAEPISVQPSEGMIAPQQPPPPIAEVPPEERPQGAQYAWIPGYWAWDSDRNDYIWVSACWRAVPPKMAWVPGYWTPVTGGWEWVTGFWTAAAVQNVDYLPSPPMLENVEPVLPQPSPDMIWVPPCMYWSNGQYIRRPGYWLQAQSNWIWVPAHYVKTPRGHVFAEGYWDYSLDRRGVLFAPIYFPRALYRRVGFSYSLNVVVDLGMLQVALFTYPRYNHYFFGDYYDLRYQRMGIYPWFESRRRLNWYDPFYEHARWRNRSNPRWEDYERDEYRRRVGNPTLRPARTFREQESRRLRLPERQQRSPQVLRSIKAAAANRKGALKFERIKPGAREKISREAVEIRVFRDKRVRWESKAAPSSEPQPLGRSNLGEKRLLKPTKTVQPIEMSRPTVKPRIRETPKIKVAPAPQPWPSTRTRETLEDDVKMRSPRGKQTSPSQGLNQRRDDVQKGRSTPERPSRSSQGARPERIQIPAPPVVGKPRRSFFFRVNPPRNPTEEIRPLNQQD